MISGSCKAEVYMGDNKDVKNTLKSTSPPYWSCQLFLINAGLETSKFPSWRSILLQIFLSEDERLWSQVDGRTEWKTEGREERRLSVRDISVTQREFLRVRSEHQSWCLPQTHLSWGRSLRSVGSDVENQLHWQAYARKPLLFLSLALSFWRSGMLFLHRRTEGKV